MSLLSMLKIGPEISQDEIPVAYYSWRYAHTPWGFFKRENGKIYRETWSTGDQWEDVSDDGWESLLGGL